MSQEPFSTRRARDIEEVAQAVADRYPGARVEVRSELNSGVRLGVIVGPREHTLHVFQQDSAFSVLRRFKRVMRERRGG